MSSDTRPAPAAAAEAAATGREGHLFIVSAPSGTGKTTLVERLVQVTPGLRLSRSYTSRAARAGEADGIDYNFITRERFQAMIGREEFLEWAEIFGNLYGTSVADTGACLTAGTDLVLVIDVQGARQIRARGVRAIGMFVLPPSFRVLEERLRGRSKDSEAQIARRLEVARQEVTAYREYDYLVVNDDLESAVDRLRAIVIAERARLEAARLEAARIVSTFGVGEDLT
jgi:guanylate kinase